MHIQIISVGKIKEKYLKLGIAEFTKRLTPYCKLSFVEIADEQAPDHLSDKQLDEVKNKEGSKILAKISQEQHVIALAIEGKQYTSEAFAQKLDQLSTHGKSKVTLIIGGSNGLSDEVLKRANEKLSFSEMTFPHQLMKLILLEQIYRAYRINRGEPYHK